MMRHKELTNFEDNRFIRDCLENTDEKGRKEIISYLRKIDKSITPELANDLVDLPSGLTWTALTSFLSEKAKK